MSRKVCIFLVVAFRKTNPTSVYLKPELRNEIELIARSLKRDVSPQIEYWLEKCVARHKRRRRIEPQKR